MSPEQSVTQWIAGLRKREDEAARALWERYFHKLVSLARARLRSARRRSADEEDVALSAFDSFCRAAAQGRFPRLDDRDDLWQVLVMITERKAADLANHEGRLKRGGGAVRGDSALHGPSSQDKQNGFERVAGREPTPEFAAQCADECRRLLGLLDDDELRGIAVLKMEGHTDEEVAAELGCVARTVRRRLKVIRHRWQKEVAP